MTWMPGSAGGEEQDKDLDEAAKRFEDTKGSNEPEEK